MYMTISYCRIKVVVLLCRHVHSDRAQSQFPTRHPASRGLSRRGESQEPDPGEPHPLETGTDRRLGSTLKGEFDGLSGAPQSGEIFGVIFALKRLADELGITAALGKSKAATLALFLVLARIAHGGSRLSAVRWAQQHAVDDLLGLAAFDEDDLYAALDWLAQEPGLQGRNAFGRYRKNKRGSRTAYTRRISSGMVSHRHSCSTM